MKLRIALLVLALAVMLLGAIYVSFTEWTSIGGDSGMNGIGVGALIGGAIGSLVVGGGLMALMFYSSRRGYDDAADPKTRVGKDR